MRYFVNPETKDINEQSYSQCPDLIGYRFLRYLSHMYSSMLVCALNDLRSPVVRDQGAIRCIRPSSKLLGKM